MTLPQWVLLGATAAQLVLLLATRFGARPAVPALGHALVLGASIATYLTGDPLLPGIALAYAGGFAALLLHAEWRRRSGWETVILTLVVLALSGTSLVYTAALDVWPQAQALVPSALACAAALGLVALGLVLARPPAPAWLAARKGIGLEVVAHGGAAMALLNILFLAFSVVSTLSLKLLFAVLFSWQVLVIAVEYRTVRHAERRRRSRVVTPLVRPKRPEPVTVVVPAANEAEVLPGSMEHNLSVPYPLRFVIVPATKSTDDTVRVAHELARRHPDRVRVVEGSTGSKADDLNLAWRTIDTKHVLLLDADETIDERSVLRALEVLRTRPDVGVVQGRKVSRAPEESALARFISAERRYSTWMDHVHHGEALGSAHFGGSAALLRREVPPSVGGWTDRTMTEDIEFTLRLHLDDRWKIAYDPEVVVRECDPTSLGELLKQRTRWARGWAQCFQLYFGDVVRGRKKLGAARWAGLVLLLLISVSALWTTFVPATLLMRLAGISPLMPLAVALPLTLILLPSRLLAYGYAAFRDPVIPVKATARRLGELALHAYLWIILGWFVQLHALYLEVSSAPRVWYVTGKRARPQVG